MTIGKDAFAFDFDFFGRQISVYTGEQKYSCSTEVSSHYYFMIEDIQKAIPTLNIPFTVGLTTGINNAFAVIYNKERFVVIDATWAAEYKKRALIMGHEMGHHVCGHTAGIMQDKPWEKELEAEQFAGAVTKALESGGVVTISSAIEIANEVFPEEGSLTHPPRAMRVQAIIQGYTSGSPCVGRVIPPIGEDIRRTAALNLPNSGLWDHNGSLVYLSAIGSSRRFYYHTPRPKMAAEGVVKSTMLLNGERNGNTYLGTTYIFSLKCGSTGRF